jgi:squalene-hopene/tetraprenyl-beta-curcumene cyclase
MRETRSLVPCVTMTAGKCMCILAIAFVSIGACCAQDSHPLPNDTAPVDWSAYQRLWVEKLPRAESTEPLLGHLDQRHATAFLDNASLQWTRQNKCATCHTSVPYLMVRPLLNGDLAAMQEVRSTVKIFAARQQEKPGNQANFLIAAAASALAVNDANAGRDLDPDVRKMLDYLWTTQDSDGGWRYSLDGMLPFLERDQYYVSLLVALGIGYAPGHYYETPAAHDGFVKLQSFLHNNIPGNPHERAVLLWASVRTPGLLSAQEQQRIEKDLLKLQNPDGGWTLPALGRWPRHDGPPNDPKGPSDGYATGLIAMTLCEAGYGLRDRPIQNATTWIETHQRASGRWFTPSTYSDRFKNYLSNMGTAYAIMALKSCKVPETP